MAKGDDKIPGGVKRRFRRRQGDVTLEGANNTLIALTTDRAKAGGSASVDDGLGAADGSKSPGETSTIIIVAGRADTETGNPDINADGASVYVSAKTEVDKNLSLGSVITDSGQISAAVVKSDAVRVVGRQNLKISLGDGSSYVFIDKDQIEIKLGPNYVNINNQKITIDAGLIELGAGAADRVILGDTWMPVYNQHVHPSAVGPTGVPMMQGRMTPKHLSQRVVKVK